VTLTPEKKEIQKVAREIERAMQRLTLTPRKSSQSSSIHVEMSISAQTDYYEVSVWLVRMTHDDNTVFYRTKTTWHTYEARAVDLFERELQSFDQWVNSPPAKYQNEVDFESSTTFYTDCTIDLLCQIVASSGKIESKVESMLTPMWNQKMLEKKYANFTERK